MAEADGRCSSYPSLMFYANFQERVFLVEALDVEAMTAYLGLMLFPGLQGQQV